MFQDTDTPGGAVYGGEEGAQGRRDAKRICLELEKQFNLICKSGSDSDGRVYTDTIKALCDRLVKVLSEEGGDGSKPCQCRAVESSATKDVHNRYERHHSRSFYMDILQVLSESCLQGYTECMEGLHGGMVVACLESVWSVYRIFSRDGKSGVCSHITFGCLVYLLQVYDCFPSVSLDGCVRDHQRILLDEIVEVLARMNDMNPRDKGEFPPFWYEFMIRGHLIVAKESKNELVENNCISIAKRILAECYDQLMPDEKVRVCSVVALHHYEKACSLEESGDCTKSSFRHCDESLKLIENVMDHVEVLEHSYELMTLMYQVRLRKAKALVCSNELKDASAEMSRIPPLQQGEDLVRILIGFEVLFMRARICMRLDEPLKCFAYLGKDIAEAIAFLKEGSDILGEVIQSLGCLIEEIIVAFPLVRDQCIPESFFNLLRVRPSVGLDAFMAFISKLQSASEPCDFAVPLFIDIISDDRIMNMVVKERDNMDACWKAFQKIAHGLFLKRKIDVCILFQQACLRYGPITKNQWSYTLLTGLYVLSQNESMAEQCLDQLEKASMRQPLIVLMRLVRMFEQQHGDVKTCEIQDIITMKDLKFNDIQWSREHLQAMDEIAVFYNGPVQHPSKLICQYQELPSDSAIENSENEPLDSLNTMMRFFEKENDLPETFDTDLSNIMAATVSSKQACCMFSKIVHMAQRFRAAQDNMHDLPSEIRVRVMRGASQCLTAGLCILEKVPQVVRNSEMAKDTLWHAQCQANIMLANEYLDIVFFSSQNKEDIVTLLDQTMEALDPFDDSEDAAMALLKFRQGILKGETNVLNEANMQYIQSLLGDECSAQFIMHHIVSPGIPVACIPQLVEFVHGQQSSCDDWSDILELSFEQQDTRRTYSIISKLVRVSDFEGHSGPVACMVKDMISRHATPDTRFVAKLSHESPWTFQSFAAAYHPKICQGKCNSKRMRLSRQEDVTQEDNGLSQTMPESHLASHDSSSHSSPQKDTGVWSTWIQKVLRRHV